MVERRRRQVGRIRLSPDFKEQWVRMPEKRFNRLNSGADLHIVKDEGGHVTFVDRRRAATVDPEQLAKKQRGMQQPPVSSDELRKMVHERPPEEVIRMLKRRRA